MPGERTTGPLDARLMGNQTSCGHGKSSLALDLGGISSMLVRSVLTCVDRGMSWSILFAVGCGGGGRPSLIGWIKLFFYVLVMICFVRELCWQHGVYESMVC